MSPTTPMLAYGTLLVSSSPTDGIDVRFAVFHDDIKFYHPRSNDETTDFFSLVAELNGVASVTQVTGNGNITLISLSALPFDLKYKAVEDEKIFSLLVVHPDPFLNPHQAGLFFEKLNLSMSLTKSQADDKLSVAGGFDAVLFEESIPLKAELSDTALDFKNSSQPQPQNVIDPLGTVSLTTFQVGTDQGEREECQVLYAFDENIGDVVHDIGRVGKPLDLRIHDPKVVKWLTGGGLKINAPTLLASDGPATKIIKAIRETNKITVEAWVTPDNTTQDGPARIVTISADTRFRNLTLGQGKYSSSGKVYDVRLRTYRTDPNGIPSTTTPEMLTTDLTHVVYTRDYKNKVGWARIYLNGVVVKKQKVEGNLSNWDDSYKLALANEINEHEKPKEYRPWHGDLHQIAIYNQALTKEQIQRNYFPPIQARGTMKLADVPAPLNEPKEVEFTFLPDQDLPPDPPEQNLFSIARSGARRYQLYVAGKKEITPSLHFKQVHLIWEKRVGGESWTLSGKVTAVLWEKLSLELTAAVEEMAIRLDRQKPRLTEQLEGLGKLSINVFGLQADQAKNGAWKWNTINIEEPNAKIKFSGMPERLDGHFPAYLRLDGGKLKLDLKEIPIISLARDFRLSKITLGFVRDQNGWSGSGTASAELFGGQFPISTSVTNGGETENRVILKIGHIGNLIELMPPVDSSDPLVYGFGPMKIKANGVVLRASEYPQGLWHDDGTARLDELARVTSEQRAKLADFFPELRDNKTITFFVGNWKVAHFVNLTVCLALPQQGNGRFTIEGYLAKDEIKDFVAFSAAGRIIRKDQGPVQLKGTSNLKVLGKEIFSGDIQQVGEKFLLKGKFDLFPDSKDWSPLRLESEGEVQVTNDGRVAFKGPATFAFPGFNLIGLTLDPTLKATLELQNGSLKLHGGWHWLGKPITLTGIRRDKHFILQGDVTFSVPFSLTLGPIYEPQTGVKVADSISVCQDENCWQTMTMKVVVELSPAGFVAKVRGQFQWQRETDKTGTGPEIKVPELTLYTPPTNQNAILSLIVDAVKDQANQLFAGKVKHAADYYITLDAKQGAKQPQLFFSSTGAPEAPIVSEMPAIFEADEDLTSEKSIFKLNQTGNTCKLTLDTTRKDQQVIRDDYDGFLTQVAEKGPINAGAANVLKRRIAERLLLDYDNLLYFYYGWDVEKGYIDLQAGMRLRVDYQNYQFVSPSDQTASNGFVGSGSSYYQLNSYLYPTNSDANQYKLGFDSFLSGIQSLETTNVTQDGAGGIVDLLDPACRQPYYRLFYPARFSGAAGRNGAERAVSLIGADSLKAMQAATKEYLKENGKLQGSDNKWVSLYFRGRATVIPEITVFVREQPLYVPVGTTVRQLMERYSNIPAALPGQDLVHLQGAFRPRRLIHEGVNSTPSYRFINYNQVQAISSGLDEFDLPVVKGDRFYF